MTDKPQRLSFRVSPRTMQMLGRDNISSPKVALIELVKNAYDADATQVSVKFTNCTSGDGEIEIIDNGIGMSQPDIKNKWMVISTGDKRRNPRTSTGRVKVG